MDFVHNLIAHWGYLGIFIIILVDNMNIPFPPTELVLTVIGWFISRGIFNIWTAYLITTVAGVLGCLFFYIIMRYAGDAVMPFLQKYLRISDAKLTKSNQFFHKYGGLALILGRIIPFMRTVSLIPAAMFHYPVLKYIIYTAIGTAIWNGAFLFFGHIIHQISL